ASSQGPTAGVVSAFSINQSSGALTSLPSGSFTTTAGPARLGSGSVGPSNGISNAMPAITELAPSGALTGSTMPVLTVFGSNFVPGAVVRWNGVAHTTSFISPSQLTVAVAPLDFATAGGATTAATGTADANGVAQVTVVNPSPGGGASTAS